MTADDSEQAARAAFARFDADGSGDVTQAEYEACTNAGVVGVPAQRVTSNLPEYDTTGDGRFGQAGVLSAAGAACRKARIAANSGAGEGASARRQDADVADISGAKADGGETVEGTAHSRPPRVLVLRRFLFSPDAHGGTDPSRMGREEAQARAMQTFAALDEDRSGTLEPAERARQRAVRPDMSDLLRTRVHQDDADTSGTLTPAEVVGGEERRQQKATEALAADGEAGPPIVHTRDPHAI